VLVGGTASAQWERVFDSELSAVYVNPMIEGNRKSVRYVSVLVDLKKPARNGTLSMRQLFEMNCKEEQFQLHFTSSFSGNMGNGSVILLRAYQHPDWIAAVPDTYFWAVMARACRSSTAPAFFEVRTL